jgi:hypothetical protein
MALAEPADRRVARHLPDRGRFVGDERGLGAHARSRCRRLAPRVAATDNNNVKMGAGHAASPIL